MSMRNFIKNSDCKKFYLIVFSIFFSLLFFYFFSYSITIASDSAHYMSYIDIFKGVSPWSSWDPVRGIVFPTIIATSILLFGKTGIGLLMGSFLFYITMLFFLFRSVEESIDSKSKWKTIFIVLILLFVIFNPIIFGYYHSLLTEFVGITLGVIGCYISWKYLKISYDRNKTLFILYSFLFIFLSVFAYALKQPYISTILFPFLVSTVISTLENFKLKNIVTRAIVLCVCIISLLLSISLWNRFLISKDVDLSSDRNVTNGLGNQLVGAIDYVKVVKDGATYTEDFLSEKGFLTEEERDLLKNHKNEEYLVVNIYNRDNEQIDSEIILSKNKFISTKDSIKFILSELIKRPISLLDSYTANYLAIIDVYKTYSPDTVAHILIREFDWNFINENQTIAYRTFYNPENIFYMSEERKERVNSFYQVNNPPILLNKFMKSLCTPFNYIFKITFLILPLSFLLSIFWRIFSDDKSSNKLLNYIIIVLGFSFLHLLAHVVTGALIDRYASPAFVTAIIGNILLFYMLFKVIFEKARYARKRRSARQQ